MIKVAFIACFIPNTYLPSAGVFNQSRIENLAAVGRYKITLIHPYCINNFFGSSLYKTIINALNILGKLRSYRVLINTTDCEVIYLPYIKLKNKYFWSMESYLIYLFNRARIKSFSTESGFDVFICSRVNPEGMLCSILKKKSIMRNSKVFIIPEGTDIIKNPYNCKGWSYIQTKLQSLSPTYVFVSQFMKNYAIQSGVLGSRISSIVVHNGYDSNLFSYYGMSSRSDKETYRLLSIGRLDNVKGYDIIIGYISNIDLNLEYYIIGTGPMKATLQSMIEGLELNERVHLLGELENSTIPENCKMLGIDAFILSSRYESFGISGIEAGSMGLPVLSTKVGVMTEYIVEDRNGYFFELDDFSSFKQAVKKCIGTNWDNEQIANSVNKVYSWERWATSLDQIIKDSLQL